MSRIETLLTAILVTSATAGIAIADSYEIDPAHTQILFKVKHLGISTVTGRFETFSGSFDFDPEKIESASVSVKIDVASISTNAPDRDTHLKSPDFFDAETYPEITFTSTKVRQVEGNRFQVAGDLTIRDVTKPVTLDVELGGTVTDPWGNERAAFTASTKIERRAFGLTWNKVLESGGLVVGNEVRIVLEVEGIRAKD